MSQPLVGIVMGSDSDLPVMKEAAGVLEELKISCEVVISSAHRVPDKTAAYARDAAGRGMAVIIAGAGGAAHLPGVIAAYTPLPVIGVPIKSGALNGVDAFMPLSRCPPVCPWLLLPSTAHETPAFSPPKLSAPPIRKSGPGLSPIKTGWQSRFLRRIPFCRNWVSKATWIVRKGNAREL